MCPHDSERHESLGTAVQKLEIVVSFPRGLKKKDALHAAIHADKQFPNHVNRPNLDCSYHFPIDLAPIGITIGTKSIGKW